MTFVLTNQNQAYKIYLTNQNHVFSHLTFKIL
jgi:hypothetical protein